MQERYLGDSHDFLKYALLRHLNLRLGQRLGINWYLTLPEQVDRPGNNDGEKRHHLKGGVWRDADPDLFERILGFESPNARSLANVEAWGILPKDTVYFADAVPSHRRENWHERGRQALAPSELIFLDPDNGFEVASMTMRTRPKYSLYEEVADYVAAGKTVVAIQFARQCNPIQRAIDVRDRLISLCGAGADLPVIRGRVAPNLLFFTLAPVEQRSIVRTELTSFVSKCAKAELIA